MIYLVGILNNEINEVIPIGHQDFSSTLSRVERCIMEYCPSDFMGNINRSANYILENPILYITDIKKPDRIFLLNTYHTNIDLMGNHICFEDIKSAISHIKTKHREDSINSILSIS